MPGHVGASNLGCSTYNVTATKVGVQWLQGTVSVHTSTRSTFSKCARHIQRHRHTIARCRWQCRWTVCCRATSISAAMSSEKLLYLPRKKPFFTSELHHACRSQHKVWHTNVLAVEDKRKRFCCQNQLYHCRKLRPLLWPMRAGDLSWRNAIKS